MATQPVMFGILSAACTLLSAPLGWWLADRRKKRAVATALAGLGGLGLILLIDHNPQWVVAMGGSVVYLWVAGLWAAWPGIVMLSATMRMLPRRTTVVLVGIFSGIVVLYITFCSLMLATFDAAKLKGVPESGYCRQTTEWSCGPAACATMLSFLGVETTEATMALRCGTVPHRGTTDYGLWHGLQATVPTDRYRVRLVKPAWEEFSRLPTPFVTSVELSPLLNHVVCVLHADARTVRYFDPAGDSRPRSVPAETFRETWLKTAVIAERTGRTGGPPPSEGVSDDAPRPPGPPEPDLDHETDEAEEI